MSSSVSSTRSAPARQPSRSEGQRPAAKPDDITAMRDALAAARHKLGQGERKPPAPLAAEPPRPKSAERDTDRGRAPTKADRTSDGQGIAAATTLGAPPPLQLPAMPAAHVDPSGFAQMLADLWTRENGKGAKEVRVRFGSDAWPATGARLVRNAAGALDVALSIDPAGRGRVLGAEALREHLAGTGLQVGAVALDDEADA